MPNAIVDFYAGSDGPTIRIDTQEMSSLEALLRSFETLSSRAGVQIDLKGMGEFTFSDAIGGLVLTSIQSPVRKKVVRANMPGITAAFFEMRGTPDDWADAKELIVPLLEGAPSHQHFSSVPPDDAIVEIAIAEPRPLERS